MGGGERERDPIALERLIEEIVVLCVRSEEYNKVVKGVLGGAASQGVEHATRALGALGAGPLNCLVRELNSYYIALEDAYMEMKSLGRHARIDNSTDFEGKLERSTGAVISMIERTTLEMNAR